MENRMRLNENLLDFVEDKPQYIASYHPNLNFQSHRQ